VNEVREAEKDRDCALLVMHTWRDAVQLAEKGAYWYMRECWDGACKSYDESEKMLDAARERADRETT